MLIDAHMHIGSWDHADFLGRTCSLADAARVMDEVGLDGAAICPTDQCKNQALLDEAKALLGKGGSKRFWLFPWVKSYEEESGRKELAWASENHDQVTGLKIHPSLSRIRLIDDGFRPALEMAEKHGWCILVHCGRWQEKASYKFAIEAAMRHPKARFVLAHGGGDTPPLATAAAELVHETKVENVIFEFSGLREYWVIERNVKLLGAERYMMGSDYGLAHPAMYIGAVRSMNISQADKDKILGQNAHALFGQSLTVKG